MKTKGKKKIDWLQCLAYFCLIVLACFTIVPIMQVITVSLGTTASNAKLGLHLFPTVINLEGYKKVFTQRLVGTAYANTVFRTIVGTVFSMIMLVLGAYPLSKRHLPNRRFWMFFITFTMYFSGGLVPSYILVKDLHMLNTMWALIIPGAVSAYDMIILRNFFSSISEELENAARIDGATDLRVLVSIVLPLSKPVLATVGLWRIVYYWNEWFNCMIYTHKEDLYVMQYFLRLLMLQGKNMMDDTENLSTVMVNPDGMKMACLVVTVFPIMCVYPFLQKYFVKGVMLGSVKG